MTESKGLWQARVATAGTSWSANFHWAVIPNAPRSARTWRTVGAAAAASGVRGGVVALVLVAASTPGVEEGLPLVEWGVGDSRAGGG